MKKMETMVKYTGTDQKFSTFATKSFTLDISYSRVKYQHHEVL